MSWVDLLFDLVNPGDQLDDIRRTCARYLATRPINGQAPLDNRLEDERAQDPDFYTAAILGQAINACRVEVLAVSPPPPQIIYLDGPRPWDGLSITDLSAQRLIVLCSEYLRHPSDGPAARSLRAAMGFQWGLFIDGCAAIDRASNNDKTDPCAKALADELVRRFPHATRDEQWQAIDEEEMPVRTAGGIWSVYRDEDQLWILPPGGKSYVPSLKRTSFFRRYLTLARKARKR